MGPEQHANQVKTSGTSASRSRGTDPRDVIEIGKSNPVARSTLETKRQDLRRTRVRRRGRRECELGHQGKRWPTMSCPGAAIDIIFSASATLECQRFFAQHFLARASSGTPRRGCKCGGKQTSIRSIESSASKPVEVLETVHHGKHQSARPAVRNFAEYHANSPARFVAPSGCETGTISAASPSRLRGPSDPPH